VRADLEEQRERRFWGTVLRVTGTSLVVGAVVGASLAAAVLLGWSQHLLLSALGLAAGAAISLVVAGSARGRQLIAALLGTVTLPALAAHLATVGATGEADLGACCERLWPFLANSAAAVLGGVTVAALWRRGAGSAGAVPEEAGAPDPSAVAQAPATAPRGAEPLAAPDRASRRSVPGGAPP
jgi:hypothetical protein